MRGRVGLLFLLLAAGCGDRKDAVTQTALERIRENRVMLIAHRGASKAMPENTLPAFQEAQAAFVDLIELDYRHTKDGRPVVIHDETLDRTTDAVARWGGADIRVASRTLDDIRQLDAGLWFDKRFRNTRVPTLEGAVSIIELEALALIERKSGDAKTLVDWLRTTGRLNSVVVQAFDWTFLAQCRALAPDLAIGALGREAATDDDLRTLRSFGAVAVGWRAKDLDAARIKRFHANGQKVWAYTVNDPEAAKKLITAGVDGIITDDPFTIGPLLDD